MEKIQEEKGDKNWKIPTKGSREKYGTFITSEGRTAGTGLKCGLSGHRRKGTPCGSGYGFL